MCLGVPAQVVDVTDIDAHLALVDMAGVRRKVNVGMLLSDGGQVDPGEWLLVHVGFALSKIDEEEARATLDFLAGMSHSYETGLAGLMDGRPE